MAGSSSFQGPFAGRFAGWRFVHLSANVRLALAAGLGLAAALLVPQPDVPLSWATRGLIGWDVGTTALLGAMWFTMARTSLSQLKRKAAQQDESASIMLGLMLAAIAVSLGGILAEMHNARHAGGAGATLFIALSLLTLVLSWCLTHVLFAVHYAHRYYGDMVSGASGGGLIFPEVAATPSYMEFVYFAFCIGMTYQVSDIMTQNRAFRRLITLHGGLSFFFNTFVLALAVNLFSGLGAGA